jgi:hypothetical protein
MLVLERRPCGVNDERREPNKYQRRLDPPGIRPHGLTKPALLNGEIRLSHKKSFNSQWIVITSRRELNQ